MPRENGIKERCANTANTQPRFRAWSPILDRFVGFCPKHHITRTMRLFLLLSSLLALAVTLVSGTALTYQLSGNEKACFYANVQRQNSKVAFYFAVCFHPKPMAYIFEKDAHNCSHRFNRAAASISTTKLSDPMKK